MRLFAELETADVVEFDAATDDAGRKRLRVLLPLMVLVHLVHIALFSPWLSRGAAGWSETQRLFHEGVVVNHVVAGAVAVVLWLLIWRGVRVPAGVLAALLYLLHGAVAAAIDQLVVVNVSAFTGYCFGIAVVMPLRARDAVAVYVVSFVVFVAAVVVVQDDVDVLRSGLLNGGSAALIGLATSILLHGARRRDFAQKATIERQKRELAALNADLEQRVKDRVKDIEDLSAQLQVRVRERSTELSFALAKLASQRNVDGTLKKGAVLGDRFEIDAPVGSGGMGAVYAGVDRATSTRVAIKVSQAASAKQLDALHRFLREAQAAATVTHPAVVRMLHVDISNDGLLFQVQELVEGTTLQKKMKKPLPPGTTARIGAVLCEALAAAHEKGVVHRDVKPQNVMLTSSSPGLKLLDFGIAKVTASADGDDGERVIVGTPAWMAPEQARGVDIDGSADVYSVGVVLFRMMSGKMPEHGATDVRAVAKIVPEDLAALVASCLAPDPKRRPSSASLAASLAAWADARHVVAVDKLDFDASDSGVLPPLSDTVSIKPPKSTPST